MYYTLPTRLFPTIPGKAAFGNLQTIYNAGEYISNKKAKNIFCKNSQCRPYNRVTKQSDLMTLRMVNNLNSKCGNYNFNKTSLNVNLITKLNLEGVKVIASQLTGASPATIIQLNSTNASYLDQNPYYVIYQIDPCGSLFGRTVCGINNYQDYRVYNPPYPTTTPLSEIYDCVK